eukprot:2361432-Pleurochrysis_carterae.AAC.3
MTAILNLETIVRSLRSAPTWAGVLTGSELAQEGDLTNTRTRLSRHPDAQIDHLRGHQAYDGAHIDVYYYRRAGLYTLRGAQGI